MIFVTVGTTEFNGLARAADELKTEDKVIIQNADGNYEPKNHKFFKYSEKFDDYLKKADIVITHGGAGTLFKLLEMNKKVIAVPNEERDDLHQRDLVNKLASEGYILPCKDPLQLQKCIKKVNDFVPKKYEAPKNDIIGEIKKLI